MNSPNLLDNQRQLLYQAQKITAGGSFTRITNNLTIFQVLLMSYQHKFSILLLYLSMAICVLGFNACNENPFDVFPASLDSSAITASFDIVLPEDGASIPKNMASPEFEWEAGDNTVWLIEIDLPDGDTIKANSKNNSWVPESDIWEKIVSSSENKYFEINIFGHNGKVLSKSKPFRFRISSHEMDRFVIYRLAHYPIDFAKEKPSLYFRDITQSTSEMFFKAKGFCFSCHVPSPDGKAMAISSRRDVLKRDKNAKLTAMDVLRIILRRELTKNIKGEDLLFVDRKENYVLVEDSDKGNQIYGSMMASWSPDNKYVLLAVKDGISGSEYLTDTTVNLTYHLTGNIAAYDVEKKVLTPVPGASEESIREFWPYFSPNGETISFSRNSETNDSDIYVVPFNNGKGGTPTPLKGASENGIREYFQRYSPNGKWIIFNRVSGTGDNFCELSDLYILPAGGGVPKKLECSKEGVMDSVASWSSDSRWISFTSRRYKNESRIFFAEIDDEGRAYPPVKMPNQEAKEAGKRPAYHHACFIKEKQNVDALIDSYNNFNRK